MVTEAELLAAVDRAFAVTGRGLVAWPAPHPDRAPLDEEYSRVTDAGRWRIVGARADAWFIALREAGLGVAERGVDIDWLVAPGTVISRTDRLVPVVDGGLPLVVARSRISDTGDAGVTLGAGDPAVCVSVIPYCGCDACDDGARCELDALDASILAVVRGHFRRLSSGDREITVFGDGGWNATDVGRLDVAAILADPRGWDEVSGPAWFDR